MNSRRIWRSGMMGLIVGDALGVPVQFMSRRDIASRMEGPVTEMESGGVFNSPAGTWSDDSSMAIATLDSFVKCGEPCLNDIMNKFAQWEADGIYTPEGFSFDEGRTCRNAIANFKKGIDILNCGIRGEYANGNGALMRIIPACLFYYFKQANSDRDLTSEAVDGIEAIASLTHNHPRSNMACGLYYFMAKEILDNKENEELDLFSVLERAIDKGIRFYKSDESKTNELEHFERLIFLSEFRLEPEMMIKSSGYVIDSIEAAIWCLITTDSLKDALLKAVNLGDDTDTVAAIAGGLAGLYYGYDKIPFEWLNVIKKKEWLLEILDEADNIFGV